MRGRGAAVVMLISLLFCSALFAQTGSDWQYFNIFNLVQANPAYPGGGAGGAARIPSWYNTPFTTVSSFTPPRINNWYGFMDHTMSIEETPVYGLAGIDLETQVDEDLIRVRTDRAVLRMDLRAATTPIKITGLKVTVWGTQDFDPNEDLAPIHPDEALAEFGQYISHNPDSAKNYYTGVQFYVDERASAPGTPGAPGLSDLFDQTDINAVVEQLGIVNRVYTVDAGLPTQRVWSYDPTMTFAGYTGDAAINIYEWDRVATLDMVRDGHQFYGWQTTIFFQNSITIPSDVDLDEPLPFKRIWVVLQTAGCHSCNDAGGGIEGISNRDTFFVGFTGPNDFYCYFDDDANHIAMAPLGHVEVTPNNPAPTLPEAQRWARSEPLYGQDTIPPYIYSLYPDNRIGSNGPHSDVFGIDGMGPEGYLIDTDTDHEWNSEPSMPNDVDQYIYTADSTQFISFKVKDQQTCIDYVIVELLYLNGGGFPCRRDSIFFWNPMEHPEHGPATCLPTTYSPPITENGGNGTGWLGAISLGTGPSCVHNHTLGSCTVPTAAYGGYELDWTSVTGTALEIGVVNDLRDTCGLDSFWIAVGNDATRNILAPFIDGAIVQVTVRAFNRNLHHHYWQVPIGGGLVAERANYTLDVHATEVQWRYVVDLSAPTAELVCPTNSFSSRTWLDNETKEYYNYGMLAVPCTGPNFNRSDRIEGQNEPYVWIADSLPMFQIRVYDDYATVHDNENHGLTYPNGAGGSGFNQRDFEITFYVWDNGVGSESDFFTCDPMLRTVTVTEDDFEAGLICVCTPDGGTATAMAQGVYFDERNDGTGGDLYVNFENIYKLELNPNWEDFLLNTGDKVYVVFTRFFDDPDFGQGSQKPNPLDPGSIDLHASHDGIADSWCGDAGYPLFNFAGNDGNYGTSNMEENHVPVMAEPSTEPCPGYAALGYHPDTLGIMRIDLRGPFAPEDRYYPPNAWTTSDTLQVITVDIFDMLGNENECVDQVPYFVDPSDDVDENPRYYGVSGVHADSIIMNVKVRGCDGSWHPAYNGPDGRNFIINDDDPADPVGHPRSSPNTTNPTTDREGILYRNLVIEKVRYHNTRNDFWGSRVVFDPTADLTALKFRAGDEVCVTVYACDNAYTNCTATADGYGPCPWCEGGATVAGTYADGVQKFTFRHFVPGMNWAQDMLHPDTHEPIDRQVARFTFYVDPTPPAYQVTTFEQCPYETKFFIDDISDHVGPTWCDEHVNNMGAVDVRIFTLDDEDCDGDGNNNYDTIFVNDLRVGNSVLIYHDNDHFPPVMPDEGFTAYYGNDLAYCVNPTPCCTTWIREGRKLRVSLDVDPADPQRRAVLTLNWDDDGPDDCLFFEPFDNVTVDIYAGDDPQTPWFPATNRPEPWAGYYRGIAGPSYYVWEHQEDCFGHIPDACDAYGTWINTRGQRRAAHVYSAAGNIFNYDRTGRAAWVRTPRNDFENPNWQFVHTETFNIQPLIAAPIARWFNDEAWMHWNTPGFTQFSYPPDLAGAYTDFSEVRKYNWVHPTTSKRDSVVADSIMTAAAVSAYTLDPDLGKWTRDMNFITFEFHSCTDSIVWECRDLHHPYLDSITNYAPYVRITAFDSTGARFWRYEDWYDCDCEHCWLSYTPMRDFIDREIHGCIDGGRLRMGPIDQLGARYDTLYDTTRVNTGSGWTVVDIDTNIYWGGPVQRIDPITNPALYRHVVAAGDTEHITWDAPTFGWLNSDSIVVVVRLATRNANMFNIPNSDTIADYHYYAWSYKVDMEPPTARIPSLLATTGYEEVNCFARHHTNNTIRVRLESITDRGVGASGGGTNPLWAVTWPLPGLVPGTDILNYLYHADLNQPMGLYYNPGTMYLYSNEDLLITNCSDEEHVARTMDFAAPISVYHGNDYLTGTVFETVLNTDTIRVADSLWAEATVQDRLGNRRDIVSRPMALDNGLPRVKGFAFATATHTIDSWRYIYDGTGAVTDSTPVYGDISGFRDWDDNYFLAPWDPEVATQESLVGVYNFSGLCTVYVRIWFDDHMDMREIDEMDGHIVRFRPEGWTHWFPVLPIRAHAGFYPLSQRYADYTRVAGGPVLRAVDPERDDLFATDPVLSDIEPGWNTDREWVGFMVIAGDALMDGVATLRVQGFDDNGGNIMLDHEFPFRIVTRYHAPTIGWPTPEEFDSSENHTWETPYGGGVNVITGYEDGPLGTCGGVFRPVTFCNAINGFDFDKTITDSVAFDVYWHTTEWAAEDVPATAGTAYHFVIDNVDESDPNIWFDAVSGMWFAQLPCDEFDLGVDAGVGDRYATVKFSVYSRYFPEDYVADTLMNLFIDNSDLSCSGLTLDPDSDIPMGTDTLIFPVTTDEITIRFEGSLIEQADYVELVLINAVNGLEQSITGGFLPVSNVPGAGVVRYDAASENLIYAWDCEGLLVPGLYILEWRVANEIYVMEGITSVTGEHVAYHHACCQRINILVPRESFVARGDNLMDALAKVSCNYPDQPNSDDIYPWQNEDMYPDYPAWTYMDSSIVDERTYMHRFQITTYNNPDHTSGDGDEFLHAFTEQGGFMGDSIYVLFEVYPGSADALLDSAIMYIEDEMGGNISGANIARRLKFTMADLITFVDCLGETHQYFVYNWVVDDQENRYDGPVEIRVTTYEHHASVPGLTVSTNHPTYLLLDTYDPNYDINLLRYSGGAYTAMRTCASTDPTISHETIWVTNADTVLIGVKWNQTIFDQAATAEGFADYDEFAHTRTWTNLRMSIDGMPHYGYHVDDPNDLGEARLWHKDMPAGVWYYDNPFWYQPTGGYDALATDAARWAFFNKNYYEYLWTVSNDARGNGLAMILVKGRDAAGNILDYEEARSSESKGKYILIDTEAPIIDPDLVYVTTTTFEGSEEAVWDNLLGGGFYDPASAVPTYVEVDVYEIGTGVHLAGPFPVLDNGSVTEDLVDLEGFETVLVCATDLAGNQDCEIVPVHPPFECCTWNLCPGWNYVALSVIPDDLTVGAIFGSEVYTMIGDALVRYDVTDVVDLDRGYMIFVTTERTIEVCGTPKTTLNVGGLTPSWNLIGAVWGGAPVTDLVTAPAGVLIETDVLWYNCVSREYVRTTTLGACRAHMVRVEEPCSLWLDDSKHTVALKKRSATPLWAAKLAVKSSDYERTLSLGVARGGSDRFDFGADEVIPPAFPGEVDAYLNGHYKADYRAESDEIAWNVVADGQITLDANVLDVPEDYNVTITVKDQVIDLRAVSHLVLGEGNYTVTVSRKSVPTEYALGQCFPNPFNAATAISFQLPEKADVKLEVFDLSGHKVASLVNDNMEAGYKTVVWNGKDDNGSVVASGVYFYKLTAGNFSETKRMVFSK